MVAALWWPVSLDGAGELDCPAGSATKREGWGGNISANLIKESIHTGPGRVAAR
jgi:hypothetical protein